MGVRGLQTFQTNHVVGGTRSVDIPMAIREWKRTHAECLIVVDAMGLCQKLRSSNIPATLCGYRYWLVTSHLEGFFKLMRDAGARLVFFFDGPTQRQKVDVWTKRQMEHYAITTRLTDELNAGTPLMAIARLPLGADFRMSPEISVYRHMCEQFGAVHVSVEHECDMEVAKYATDHGALAILAQDTDFLIFPGDFQYWSTYLLCLATGHTVEYVRSALRTELGLSESQMPYFAALCGNDFLLSDVLWPFQRALGCRTDKFRVLAAYTRKNYVDQPANRCTSAELRRHATTYGFDVALFWQSVDSYDVGHTCVAPSEGRLCREAFGSLTVLTFLHPYVNAQSFDAFDFRHERLMSVMDLFVPLYRRQAGIVWLDRVVADADAAAAVRCRLRTRRSHSSKHEVLEMKPIYPSFATPPLKTLLLGPKSDDHHLTTQRYRLLAWLVSGDDTLPEDDAFVKRLRALRGGYVLILLTLYYLTKMNQFTVAEADAILAAEMDVLGNRVPRVIEYPKHIQAHNLLLVRLYVLFHTCMRRSMELCGFADSKEEQLRFDSVHFHKLCTENTEGGAFMSPDQREGFAELRSFYASGG